MRYSQTFVKTLRQPPKEADTLNHKLLTQAGYVEQLMAGVYNYLPLGLRVLRKIENIVRHSMNELGGEEILMAQLHPKQNWVTTGGWDKIDVLFKINSRTEKEYALGQSEEEVVTPLVMSRVNTYKDLPIAVYQIHWKFRDELRAKSGLMRGREFLMKDMYSFHETQADFDEFYAKAKKAYIDIYKEMGLVAKATEASGGSFSDKTSYEFMVLTDAGEDDILYCSECDYCVNTEIAKVKVGESCPSCGQAALQPARASEVGNIFDLGQKYGKDFDLTFLDREGNKQYPIMGCFGIGISRAMGVIVEKFNDERGILWPQTVAPFQVHLLGLDLKDEAINAKAEQIYTDLQAAGIEVLFDDRVEAAAGQKFTDSDLLGIPYRVVVSRRTGDNVELKQRDQADSATISVTELKNRLTK